METYIVAIEDLFRVEAESEEEAKKQVVEQVNSMDDSFTVRNTKVIEQEE